MLLPATLASIKAGVALLGASQIAILPLLLALVAYFHYDQFDPENRPADARTILKSYDFVVIGAGSAGSVVANRLTEIPDWKVLLIEAGGHETEITDVPILSLYLHKSKVDWGYKTEPQDTACLAMIEKRCSWTRGKVLGGSSVLNTMLYVRGNRRDFDNWAQLGNPGWSYEEILPYFKKSEDQRNPYLARNKYHATGGYQTVQDSPYNTPLGPAFLEAGQQLGYDIRDINGEQQTGFAFYQFTMRRASRCSTSKAFLRPIRLRKNFHLSIFSHVTKILIDPKTKRAFGVDFVKNGQRYRVLAKKEVILSAGAINTPQLLMLSGVGPAQHLQQKGIQVIHNSPGVGKNLQDHIAVGGTTFVVDQKVAIVMNRLVNLNSALRYAVTEDGPLTTSIGLEAVGFITTKYGNQTDDWPDIEFMITSASVNSDGGQQVARAHGLTPAFYRYMYDEINYKDSFSVLPMMLRPRSRGEILLRSNDPFAYPLLYHNYLTDPRDLAVLREGLKSAIAYGRMDAFKKYGARFHDKPLPNCRHLPAASDAYYDCVVRQYTLSIYHYSCTAKMGPAEDPMAVVDPQLRVYGVGGLRVIDASIMPQITNGNINAPVIMIGEKGADMVKNYWLNVARSKRRGKRDLWGNRTISR